MQVCQELLCDITYARILDNYNFDFNFNSKCFHL